MLTTEIIVILFTRRLPYVQCAENRLTCGNYIGNYEAFQERPLNSQRLRVFPGAISNSTRFRGVPGVVDTLLHRHHTHTRTHRHYNVECHQLVVVVVVVDRVA